MGTADFSASGFPVVETSSAEEAHQVVARLYLPDDPRASSEELDTRPSVAPPKRGTLGFLGRGAPAGLRMPPTETSYQINLTTKRQTSAERRDEGRARSEAESSAGDPPPDQRNTVRWSRDAKQLILKIPRVRLESHLADLIGRAVVQPIEFDFDFDLDMTTPQGRSLLASVEFLAQELDRVGGIADIPLARDQLEGFVMTQVLIAVRNSYTDLLTGHIQRASGGRIKPVLDYIERNVDQPITPPALAQVGCMSVRALHATFQQELGMSPMAYLRRVRLDRVRSELLRCGGKDVRISDIATRWGFFHPSRFARQYHARFGELPSETLRQRTA